MVYISGGSELINPDYLFKQLDIQQGMRIADLGCGGNGRFCIPAGRLVGQRGIIYAVDILKSVLQEVAKKARLEGVNNVKPIWSNLEIYGATKIKDSSVNIAFLINILFQAKEHKEIIREATRILKPGGKLLIVDWTQTATPFGPSLVDRVKPEDLKKIARNINLELVDEFKAGKYHFGLLFIKPEEKKEKGRK